MFKHHVRGWTIGGGLLLVGVAVWPAFAGQAASNQDVLGALLVEVRALRMAMEQMSSAGARVQLAMGRLQLQEQRINTLLRRLEGIRDQKLAAEREVADLRGRASQLEDVAAGGPDPLEQKAVAAQSRELERLAQQRTKDLQGIAAEEAEVANAVAAEQSRWNDINRTLEELERVLTRR